MIRRLYVHNFRCLENFELRINGRPSTLLVGKNGSGKSSVRSALELLQNVGRGITRVRDLIQPDSFAWGRSEVPMRFEIEIMVNERHFGYTIAFDFAKGFTELRVFDEKLTEGGEAVFSRDVSKVTLRRHGREDATFNVDWHMAALPFLHDRGPDDPLNIVRLWLARMIILRPVPKLMTGDSDGQSLEPDRDLVSLGNWFAGLVADSPFSYATIEAYLREVMPDLKSIRNPEVSPGSRRLMLQFNNGLGSVDVAFKDLSDGEKCLFAGALVLASREVRENVFCFWDEPDSHLSLSEVGHFILALRAAFESRGQFIATSHNPEAIQKFSDDTTLMLARIGHLDPVQVRSVTELQTHGDLVTSLILDDLKV